MDGLGYTKVGVDVSHHHVGDGSSSVLFGGYGYDEVGAGVKEGDDVPVAVVGHKQAHDI